MAYDIEIYSLDLADLLLTFTANSLPILLARAQGFEP